MGWRGRGSRRCWGGSPAHPSPPVRTPRTPPAPTYISVSRSVLPPPSPPPTRRCMAPMHSRGGRLVQPPAKSFPHFGVNPAARHLPGAGLEGVPELRDLNPGNSAVLGQRLKVFVQRGPPAPARPAAADRGPRRHHRRRPGAHVHPGARSEPGARPAAADRGRHRADQLAAQACTLPRAAPFLWPNPLWRLTGISTTTGSRTGAALPGYPAVCVWSPHQARPLPVGAPPASRSPPP